MTGWEGEVNNEKNVGEEEQEKKVLLIFTNKKFFPLTLSHN